MPIPPYYRATPDIMEDIAMINFITKWLISRLLLLVAFIMAFFLSALALPHVVDALSDLKEWMRVDMSRYEEPEPYHHDPWGDYLKQQEEQHRGARYEEIEKIENPILREYLHECDTNITLWREYLDSTATTTDN